MTPIEWILEAGCIATKATPEQICGRTRNRWAVIRRRFIARKMRQEGYTLPQIGRALGRHHTTIMNLLDWSTAIPERLAA